MSVRKEVMKDPAVRAAVAALKEAVLAVNGDETVTSSIVLIDVAIGGGKGMVAVDMDICSCPSCLHRYARLLGEEFATAAAQDRKQERRAVH